MDRARRCVKLRRQIWQIGAINTGDIIATNISAQNLAADAGELSTSST
jgi:hypothetical protein